MGLGSERSSLLRQTLKGVAFLNNSVTPYDDTSFRLGHPELFAFGKDLYDRHRAGEVALTARVDFLIRRQAITVMQLEEGGRLRGRGGAGGDPLGGHILSRPLDRPPQ